MNKIVSHSMAVAVGGCIGAALGYFITKSRLEASVDAQVRERVGDVIKSIGEKEQKDEDKKPEETKKKEPAAPKAHHKNEIGLKEAYDKMIAEKGYSEKSGSEDDVMRISEEEYGVSELDVRTLYYNAEHHILLDEDGEPVDRKEMYVGSFDLEEYFDSGDNDSVYFRNEKLDTDYEILLTMKGPDED